MIMSIIPCESQLVGETFSENRDVKEAIETKWFSFKVDKLVKLFSTSKKTLGHQG